MRVLVSAATKHGATSEIATVIGEVLFDAGLEVEVLPPDEVTTLAPYEAVVLGSGIYAGRWLDPAKALIERELDALLSRRVWLFSSGPIGEPPKPEGAPADGTALSEATHAVEHRVFAGRLERGRLGFGERTLLNVMRAPEGDFRPWPEIQAWAASIAAALRPAGRGLGASPVAALVR